MEAYKIYSNRRPIILGGLNTKLQADETVLSRRGIIRCPTKTDDETPGTIWILGVIDVSDKQKFLLKRVENRQVTTLVDILKQYVEPFGTFVTDGYPSYPGVTEELSLEHIIVNHTNGFKNESNEHTNDIESF
ncbi:hypothetical protein DMUE_2694 [Dictyocoela muelleri]|nr:hypothetical protein DMUE_2694 [Dictyocoela muelleri]